MTPDPKALAVLLDAARAAYGDETDVVRWLANPEAVRSLLAHDPTSHGDCHQCAECGQHRWEGHLLKCGVFAAWWALRHPLLHAAIDAAWNDALDEEARRLPEGFTSTPNWTR